MLSYSCELCVVAQGPHTIMHDHRFQLKRFIVNWSFLVMLLQGSFTKACFHYTRGSSSFAVICKPAGVRGNSMNSGNDRLLHASSHTCTMPMKVLRLQVGDQTSDTVLVIDSDASFIGDLRVRYNFRWYSLLSGTTYFCSCDTAL